jgi:hypothetical protein
MRVCLCDNFVSILISFSNLRRTACTFGCPHPDWVFHQRIAELRFRAFDRALQVGVTSNGTLLLRRALMKSLVTACAGHGFSFDSR